MAQLPDYISILWMLTTFLTIALFCRASAHPKRVLLILLPWLALQGFFAASGFYTFSSGTPPRISLAVLPPLVLIAVLLLTAGGRRFIDRLDLGSLTLLHIVRLPVEIGLYLLFLHGTVPELMTFEGRNLDILSGISAPAVLYLGYKGGRPRRGLLIGWNLLCLGLLFNIVVHAILSAPSEFQQLAFDQPNIAVLYFPMVWLPCCIVPIVLLAHVSALRQLLRSSRAAPAAAASA